MRAFLVGVLMKCDLTWSDTLWAIVLLSNPVQIRLVHLEVHLYSSGGQMWSAKVTDFSPE